MSIEQKSDLEIHSERSAHVREKIGVALHLSKGGNNRDAAFAIMDAVSLMAGMLRDYGSTPAWAIKFFADDAPPDAEERPRDIDLAWRVVDALGGVESTNVD